MTTAAWGWADKWPAVTETHDVPYATAGGHSLCLDVFVIAGAQAAPAVLYVHGGAFRFGDKGADLITRLRPLAQRGLGMVSVNYRLAPEGRFPDPVHDLKAAIRFIRARGSQFGLDASRIGILGVSAGGYLATMAMFTAGIQRLDGTLGDNLDATTDVQAAVLWSAPVDVRATARRTELERNVLPLIYEANLLGSDDPLADPRLVGEASPLCWVRGDGPPQLIQHGDRDQIIPVGESEALHDSVVRLGGDSTLVILGGAGHEDARFHSEVNLDLVAAWLHRKLSPTSDQRT